MRHAQFVLRSLAVGLAVLLARATNAAEPSIHDAVKASIERKTVHKTDMAGFGVIKNAYRHTGRDGAVVVGFDAAVGPASNSPRLLAISAFSLAPPRQASRPTPAPVFDTP